MTIGVSPDFPYAGKGSFDINVIPPGEPPTSALPDQMVIRGTAAARRGFFSGDPVETFIVYGDIEKGSFQLASHDGKPMGLVPGMDYAQTGVQINCQHLVQTTTFSTIHLDHTKKSQFGPSFNCNNQGLLSCVFPAEFGDKAR